MLLMEIHCTRLTLGSLKSYCDTVALRRDGAAFRHAVCFLCTLMTVEACASDGIPESKVCIWRKSPHINGWSVLRHLPACLSQSCKNPCKKWNGTLSWIQSPVVLFLSTIIPYSHWRILWHHNASEYARLDFVKFKSFVVEAAILTEA